MPAGPNGPCWPPSRSGAGWEPQPATASPGHPGRQGHTPLATEIVQRAHQAGLAGASMFRGVEGYGAANHIHTTRILSLSDDLPIAVVIVDTAERIGGSPKTPKVILGTGFCGAYTTFSTFTFETVRLVQEGAVGEAFRYAAGTLVTGATAAALGVILASL